MKMRINISKNRDLLVLPIIIAILLILITAAELSAAPNELEMQRIDRDISIMENVLDKLIIKESPLYFHFDDHVQGIYLDGFGVLFDVESMGLGNVSDLISKTLRTLSNIKIRNEDHGLRVYVDEDDPVMEDYFQEVEEKIAETRELLEKFYVDYASAVKSLRPEDRICVNIRIKSEPSLPFENKKNQIPEAIRTCVKVAELEKYRRGKIDDSQLINAIQYSKTFDNGDGRDLEIMERILDTSMKQSSRRNIPNRYGNTRGMYLEGFGALFFTPITLVEKNVDLIVKNLEQVEEKLKEHEKKLAEFEDSLEEDDDSDLVIVKPKPPKITVRSRDDDTQIIIQDKYECELSQSQIDSIITNLQNELIEIVGQYGSTIRPVQKNECIMLAVDLDAPFTSRDYGWLYIKVQKADIDLYMRDALRFDEFKRRVKIWRG
jgi:hypothetical protein